MSSADSLLLFLAEGKELFKSIGWSVKVLFGFSSIGSSFCRDGA